jgi:hypothetical protein
MTVQQKFVITGFMFFFQLLIGAVLVILTVIIHAVSLERLMIALKKIGPFLFRKFRRHWKIPLIVITVGGVFLAHIVEIWVWAAFYLWVGALGDLEDALYFSTSTFTTVGYGDVVLQKEWRLISSFQAANGFLLFGWSTAFIYEIMSKIYKNEKINSR